MNTDLATVFQRTRLALREQGWCQGEYAILHQGDQLPRLCLSAALLRGCGMSVAPTAVMTQYSDSCGWTPNSPRKYLVGNTKTERGRIHTLGTSKQRTLLITAIRVLYALLESDHQAPDLTSYNDDPDRQLTEILDLLRRGEEKCREDRLGTGPGTATADVPGTTS